MKPRSGENSNPRTSFVRTRLDDLVSSAVKQGASYCDVRYERLEYEELQVVNKTLRSYSSRTGSGTGIRVIMNGSVGFSSTNDPSEKGLSESLEAAIRAAKSLGPDAPPFTSAKPLTDRVVLPARIDPSDVSPEEKLSLVMDANKAAAVGEEIRNSSTRMGIEKDYRLFVSSEGSDISTERTLLGLSQSSVARVNGVMESVSHGQSKCLGFEFLQSRDWNAFAAEISQLAIDAAKAGSPPAGTYAAVVDPYTVGIVLHEAFGHASEADGVWTGYSCLTGRLGTEIAGESVTIADQGMIEDGFVFPYDDEGVKKGKTVVVEKGKLIGFLHDRTSASKLGSEPTGNGRAQDCENTTMVRQTNFFMEPGDYTFQELLEDIEHGIYIRGKGAGGGQVNSSVGTFTFGVGPSQMIRKGELAEPVRGVVISGLILETLKTIDAVGKDFQMRTSVFGGCGKGNQRARTGDGGPHIRVHRMTVGGR